MKSWPLTRLQDGVSVGVVEGPGSDPPRETLLSCAYLVAADGARSRVRKALDIPFEGYSFDDRFLIADIRAELDFALERRFFFDPEWNPGRQVLVHPQPDSVWRIDWQVPADFDLETERRSGALERRIRQITGERDYELVWGSSYRFHQRRAERFGRGRCFLAGDAAHLMAPFGARGLNSGIQDAENLAWKLGWVLRGWAGSDLLDSYCDEREAAADENLRVTGKTMEFLVPRTADDRARRRRILEQALGDQTALEQVDSGKLAEPYNYDRSPLTASSPGTASGGLALGALCPDWGAGEGRQQRLRTRFGLGVTVVSAGLDESTGDPVARARSRLWRRAPSNIVKVESMARSVDLMKRLGIRTRQALLVRPDGHVADRYDLSWSCLSRWAASDGSENDEERGR